MFVLRIVGFFVVATIGASLLTYLVTKNRRYVTFAWQVLKYGMIMAIVVLTFILFERRGARYLNVRISSHRPLRWRAAIVVSACFSGESSSPSASLSKFSTVSILKRFGCACGGGGRNGLPNLHFNSD